MGHQSQILISVVGIFRQQLVDYLFQRYRKRFSKRGLLQSGRCLILVLQHGGKSAITYERGGTAESLKQDTPESIGHLSGDQRLHRRIVQDSYTMGLPIFLLSSSMLVFRLYYVRQIWQCRSPRILMLPSLPRGIPNKIMMLLGLTSRWTIPRSCA